MGWNIQAELVNENSHQLNRKQRVPGSYKLKNRLWVVIYKEKWHDEKVLEEKKRLVEQAN